MSYILPATWAKAERLYFQGERSLKDIAKDCGISLATLHRRIRSRGWPSHKTLELDGASSERAQLRRVIGGKLERLERRMQKPDTDSATDSERQAREFGSLMTTVDKLDAKENAWRKSLLTTEGELAADTNNNEHGDDHVDQWRAELAQRIARLSAKRNG